ncbi:MAG: hypothetical protein ACLFMY_07445, partial [Guyparkeria sp.]|uniref:hypothetical protein n=1 Tax=Guyparkeria sp. TaxID=2035736 RepID=UPI003979D9C1
MAQHTPKVDPISKVVGFVSALVLLAAVFYLVNALFSTVDRNTTVGEAVEKPEVKEETKTASADDDEAEKSSDDDSEDAGGDDREGDGGD